jgi:hypothetical protein
MSTRRRPTAAQVGFRLSLAAGFVALAAGMLLSVARGAQARRTSERLSAIERQTVDVRARLTEGMRRLDSLGSRERILAAAAKLGLHPASDSDISFLRVEDAGASHHEPAVADPESDGGGER